MSFPPRTPEDISGYDDEELVRGFTDWRPGDPLPGPNHSDAYRWGAQNRYRDSTGADDGFIALRHEYYHWAKAQN